MTGTTVLGEKPVNARDKRVGRWQARRKSPRKPAVDGEAIVFAAVTTPVVRERERELIWCHDPAPAPLTMGEQRNVANPGLDWPSIVGPQSASCRGGR